MKIAYVCYKQGRFPASVEGEDQYLLNFLRNKGLDLHMVTWTDPGISWEDFQLVIIKSPWDYFEEIDVFYKWLDSIDELGIRILNPSSTIRWNANKYYLKDIGESGLAIIASLFLKKGQSTDLRTYFEKLETETIIIKPCISAGSVNTYKIGIAEADSWNRKLNGLLKAEDYIIQPFVPQIAKEGEYSFLFFNGRFSHHVLKKAKEGDFRVQANHGGSIHVPHVSSELVEQAKQYADRFAKGCLYARVDGILIDGEFNLMELELIEPFLFLDEHQNSYQNYYQALQTFLV